MARLTEEKALTIWKSLALDAAACKLFRRIRLEAEWDDTGYSIEGSGEPIVEKRLFVSVTPREGASAVALLELVVNRCGVDPDFDARGGYTARLIDGKVVIA